MNVWASGLLDDTTGAVLRKWFYYVWRSGHQLLIVLDLAATLLTPKTPKVFCGLKHFNLPSIGIFR